MITITLNTDNDAFAGYGEKQVARILRDLADSVEVGIPADYLYDINGNRCGTCENLEEMYND
jgi:hypothetical protein